MEDFSRSIGRRTLGRVALLLSVLIVASTAAVAPATAQPQSQSQEPAQQISVNTTNATNGTNGSDAAPAPSEAIPASCEDIRENPAGKGPDYRVVEGACAIELQNGEVLSNVWFKADGARIDIWARGSGWTIRNIAITNHGANDQPPLNLRVTARDGVGLVHNVWVSDAKSNVLFVHPKHAGAIRFEQVTFLRVGEDAAYSSRPGNPVDSSVGGIDGQGGIVGFDQAYVKNTGMGPKSGYGLRLGSDGSYVTNSTIVATSGPAIANTFAGGKHRNRHQGAVGVLFRNVNIVTDNVGLRVNNHQGGLKGKRQWTSVTTLQNVQISAGTPIQRNEAGGKEPIIRGDYGTNPTTAPPPGAPRSPVRAASGIGGGTGSIGGPVAGPGDGGFVSQIASFVALGVIGFVLALVAIAVGAIALLERNGDNGGFP